MIEPGDNALAYACWNLDNESLIRDLLRVHELRFESVLISSKDMAHYIEMIRDEIMVRIATERWLDIAPEFKGKIPESEVLLPCPCRFCVMWVGDWYDNRQRVELKIRLWKLRQ